MKNFCQKCGRSFQGPKGKLFCDNCLLEEQKELKQAMEDKSDQSLQELAETHSKLVKELKEHLYIGQAGFLLAGKDLCEIKTKKTYLAEDASHEWTWKNFLARPDLPFPGSTPESSIRIAEALIRIYKVFVQKLGYKEEELAPIGWKKLDLLAGPVEKDELEFGSWIDKAKELTLKSLYAELRGKDEEIGAGLTCKHENEYLEWKCPDCGARSKEPMSPKHKSWHVSIEKPST